MCDGLSADIVERGCREGWLPNIRRRLWERGTTFDQAVAVVPSITYASLATMATGREPAQHGILGNVWFDRQARLLRDYGTMKHYRSVNRDLTDPTLYEMVRPLTSASIQSALIRGLTRNFDNWAPSGVMWFFHDYTAVDKLTASTVEQVAGWANAQRRWPDVLTCYFPGVDTIGHIHGPQSPRYQWAVKHFDHQLGRVCDWLEREGLLDSTLLVLVSDHGLVPVEAGGRIDLPAYVQRVLGLRVTTQAPQSGGVARRRRWFDRSDAVVVAAQRNAHLHLVGPTGWDARPAPREVEALLESAPTGQRLWELPGVELVVYACGPDQVMLRSARGQARIQRRTVATPPPVAAGRAPQPDASDGGSTALPVEHAEYRYVPESADVFGYCTDPRLAEFVAAGFHGSRDWLRATCGQTYPDAVPHLVDLLESPRCGEVLIFAACGYSFVVERGGHGGLRREEMRIPFVFAGPGVRPGRQAGVARVTDLVATVMDFLEVPAPSPRLAGVSLLPILSGESDTLAAAPGSGSPPAGWRTDGPGESRESR